MTDEQNGLVIYLLACLECADHQHLSRAFIPFDSAAERGKWAAAHTRGTGHDRWWVKDQRATEVRA